jgi:thiol-disulfide isomerase/thioredoxin
MKGIYCIALLSLALASAQAIPNSPAAPGTPPEFTHHRQSDWLNSEPLTLAALKGKVVLLEVWAFKCVNCLNSRAWVDSVEQSKAPAGLVVVGIHTPELREEEAPDAVKRAVERLQIHHPVMIDTDKSYWKALHNQYWPAFYLIGRDGRLYGPVLGEMHVGEARSQQLEQVIDELLKASPT